LNETDKYQIAIIGGGPAGFATALRLRQLGFERTMVVEAGNYSGLKVGETIQPPCRELLEGLELWESFLEDAHLPAELTAAAWGSVEVHFNDFIYRPVGKGWHLDRQKFDRRLGEIARERGISILKNTRFRKATFVDGVWHIEAQSDVDGRKVFKADFVVDASGRTGIFAKSQGAEKVQFDELFGSYQFFEVPDGMESMAGHALVETVPDGWWYSAKLPQRGFVAAFMSDLDTVKLCGLRESANWNEKLRDSHHTLIRCQGLKANGSPVIRAANSFLLDRIFGKNWLAVGDAAAAYDPLSSMGIYQALKSGVRSANAIAAERNGKVGAFELLAEELKDHFREYLQIKARFYDQEKRWAKQAFWEHRHQQIHLSPHALLVATDVEIKGNLNMYLGPNAHAEILKLCRNNRPAHEVIGEFQALHETRYSDTQVILAVQYLLQKGNLRIVR
jgi:flavin-dependent dehydrogenase